MKCHQKQFVCTKKYPNWPKKGADSFRITLLKCHTFLAKKKNFKIFIIISSNWQHFSANINKKKRNKVAFDHFFEPTYPL